MLLEVTGKSGSLNVENWDHDPDLISECLWKSKPFNFSEVMHLRPVTLQFTASQAAVD